jgi:WD40 repeat protein/tRNA A-37 threonylcarbamoyl transferase component Bud32
MTAIATEGAEAQKGILLGLAAFRENLISEEILLGCLRVWSAESTACRIEEVLLSHGGIDARQLQWLAEIVQKELNASSAGANDLAAANGPALNGRFRLLRVLSQGGLGEIFIAHDEELNRRVAVKSIQEKHANHAECRIRFLREAEITGSLEHPGIIPVYSKGENSDGRPYYAMRFIEGETLQEAIARFHRCNRPLDAHDFELRQLLGRFVAVCNALAYAHSQGVLHRDVKPSNIMLGNYGETLILDWGLARSLQNGVEQQEKHQPLPAHPLSHPGVTQVGRVMGTPQYMSPEQAAGLTETLSPASDVYSLGATLYSLLTGSDPFAGVEDDLVVHLVQGGDFPRPRLRKPGIPAALEAVCMKAMRRVPEQRYPSARALADDLERWLADDPVTAYEEPRLARFFRQARRHKGKVGIAGGVAVLALTIAAAGMLLSAENRRQLAEKIRADSAEKSRSAIGHLAARALMEEGRANHYLYFSRINLADRAWQEAQVYRMNQLLSLAEESAPKMVGFEWHYLWRLCHSSVFTFNRHRQPVTGVVFSPDGKHVASCAADGAIMVWEFADEHQRIKLEDHSTPIASIAFSPDGMRLASGSADGLVKVWNVAHGAGIVGDRCLCTMSEHSGAVNAVAYSSDGRTLVSAGDDQSIRIWSSASLDGKQKPQLMRILHAPGGRVVSVALSPNGRLLASAQRGGNEARQVADVDIWDLARSAAQPISTLHHHHDNVSCLAFSPDGRFLATASFDETVKLWETKDLNDPDPDSALTLRGHLDTVTSLAFSQDSRRLASGSDDRTVRIWAIAKGEEEMIIRGHSRPVTCVAFGANDRFIASGSLDNTVRVWDALNLQEAVTLKGHLRDVNSISYSPDAKWIATGSDDQTVRIWPCGKDRSFIELGRDLGGVNVVAFDPSGARLAAATQTGQLYVWNLESRELIARLDAGKTVLTGMSFSHNGRLLAATAEDGRLRIWDSRVFEPAASLAPQTTETGIPTGLTCLAFSPDDGSIALGSGAGAIHLFDVASGAICSSQRGYATRVTAIAYSPDGRGVATASADRFVRLWDTSLQNEIGTFRGHSQTVTSLVFSPDGARLASAGNDRIIKVWDVETREEALNLKGHTDTITSLAFSPNGRILVSASDDGTAKIWSSVYLDTSSPKESAGQ